MAKYFRTPNIDIKTTRVKDGRTEKSLEAILLEKIDEMIEKKIPLTKTKLSRETGIGGNSFNTYAAIFDDTIDMLRMFEFGTKDKEGELATVPDFDKLSKATRQLIDEHLKKADRLYALIVKIQELEPQDNNIFSRNVQQLEDIYEAFWGYLAETPLIHDAFIGVNSIDDVDHLIEEKYKHNQALKEKLSRLEEQVAKEGELLKGTGIENSI